MVIRDGLYSAVLCVLLLYLSFLTTMCATVFEFCAKEGRGTGACASPLRFVSIPLSSASSGGMTSRPRLASKIPSDLFLIRVLLLPGFLYVEGVSFALSVLSLASSTTVTPVFSGWL